MRLVKCDVIPYLDGEFCFRLNFLPDGEARGMSAAVILEEGSSVRRIARNLRDMADAIEQKEFDNQVEDCAAIQLGGRRG